MSGASGSVGCDAVSTKVKIGASFSPAILVIRELFSQLSIFVVLSEMFMTGPSGGFGMENLAPGNPLSKRRKSAW